ncbi:MAG: polyprenol monophosphomannose synthase [Actinomycetales bacterium]|nr:polyprenol monophosphomannose synthase [Actinomycetales bacterium]
MQRLVVIPTYNEVGGIEILLTEILKTIKNLDILVVDGGSNDGTSQAVAQIVNLEPRVNLISEGAKRGLGKAYLAGFAWGLERGYEKIIEMDADLSHRVLDLSSLLEAKADLVIGSRWIVGGGIENWSKSRELLSRIANKYVQFMLKLDVSDATSGFREYRADLLRKIDLKRIKSEGYTFQIEMVRAARKVGAEIVEVPIIFREREFGKSKISRGIIFEALLRVSYWGLKRIGGGGGI